MKLEGRELGKKLFHIKFRIVAVSYDHFWHIWFLKIINF